MPRRRRIRREPPRWEKDWRNPNMKVLRAYRTWSGAKIVEEMEPEDSSQLSWEGMQAELPDYRSDPSYRWAEDAERKRSG